jgi:hypothetical protein
MKPIEIVLRRGEWMRGTERGYFGRGRLYPCVEVSQWTSFVQII